MKIAIITMQVQMAVQYEQTKDGFFQASYPSLLPDCEVRGPTAEDAVHTLAGAINAWFIQANSKTRIGAMDRRDLKRAIRRSTRIKVK